MSDTRETFELPVVRDYGDLVGLTSASLLGAAEDGAGKDEPHHTFPISP